MPSSQCYDSIYCYDDPDCPLFNTCQQIKTEEEAADEITKQFLGDHIEDWKPTGLSGPEENL